MPEIINIPSSLYSHRPVSELLHIYATTYGSIVNHPPSIHVPILFCVCISTVGLFFYWGGGGGPLWEKPQGTNFLPPGSPDNYFAYAVVGVLRFVYCDGVQFILNSIHSDFHLSSQYVSECLNLKVNYFSTDTIYMYM